MPLFQKRGHFFSVIFLCSIFAKLVHFLQDLVRFLFDFLSPEMIAFLCIDEEIKVAAEEELR